MYAKHALTILVGMIVMLGASGCATTAPDRAERMTRGYVYYLDGAGGGGITNWSGGVRQGLRDAGYDGAGEMFSWETGLGVLADQEASNEYKRGKAAKLAQKMVEYHRQYPDAPMNLMGLSAGTVIAVFALEALPANVMVENVILLSGSLSAPYDLTEALGHVRGKVYVTTSHRDSVLGGLLPLAGTADRGSGTNATIGVEGPRLPRGSSSGMRSLYASKLVVVPWKQEFARYGNYGGHTDTVAGPFVERYVAPLVKTTSGKQFASAATAAPGTVKNPDYERWARFEPGSWVVMEGQQTIDGVTRPIRMKVTLVSKSASQLVFRREQLAAAGQQEAAPFPQTIYASAHIAPDEHPMTHPAAQVRDLPGAKLRVGSREFVCKVKSISTPAEFRDWGSHPQATVYACEEVPCGIVQVDLKTKFGQKSVAATGKLVGFQIAKR
jgi:hypothetical protein